jgi:thiamine biosynthesis lipoprotein
LNRQSSSDWFDVSPETAQVSSAALRLSRETNGAFDPTISPLVDLWNFGPEKTIEKIPSESEIARVMESVGPDLLQVRGSPPAIRKLNAAVQLDLSGIAKGYAVDRLAELVKQRGAEGFMIEIGGEVRVGGQRSPGRGWRIGIEAPDDQRRSLARAVQLENQSLATSGDYRNFFIKDGVRYSHLIDPSTGSPIKHRLKSVSVIHSSCMEADALATALMIMGPDEGYRFAVERELAALFFVMTDDETTEKMTPEFANALLKEDNRS